MTPAVEIHDAFRIYRSPGGATVALRGLTLGVEPGEIVAVLGPSGSGKTTLLRAIAGFETLSAGSVRVFGTDLGRLSAGATAAFRAANLGFLDQHYALTLSPDLSSLDTVALQLELAGRDPRDARSLARDLLARVGLDDRTHDRPETLSGGEQQRVAVCAAVAHGPKLLLADEPAGELDADSAETIYRLLAEIVREAGGTAVIVTHDAAAVSIADRLVNIRGGRLGEESTNGGPPSTVAPPAGRSVTRSVRATDVVAELRDVSKSYGRRRVFSGLSHAFEGGRLAAVTGRSGSGKTTLLHLLAGLERPGGGDVLVCREPLDSRSRSELAALRRRSIGLVTQEPGLVPYLSALENVALALGIRNGARREAGRAEAALTAVGLGEQLHQRAASLSAGERQRVAIARALAGEVSLLLVDEPTARLDEESGRLVAALLAKTAEERGVAVVCATHDPVLIALADDVLALETRPGAGRTAPGRAAVS